MNKNKTLNINPLELKAKPPDTNKGKKLQIRTKENYRKLNPITWDENA